jgi:hypothetical protein
VVKHSCSLAVVVLDQPTKPLTAVNATLSCLSLAGRREQEVLPKKLVCPKNVWFAEMYS